MEVTSERVRAVHRTSAVCRVVLVLVMVALQCPEFTLGQGQEEMLHYKIQEESEVGAFLGNVARDSKLYSRFSQEEFQKLLYSVSTQGSKFTIDENTSTLRTGQVLDRETECEFNSPSEPCELEFDVSILKWDQGIKMYDLLMIVHVSVLLEDINDNAPQFPSDTVYLSVPESVPVGHVLLTSGAFDTDSAAKNNIQEYRLLPESGAFRLEVMTGVDGMSSDLGLVVQESLDRERQTSYYMQVVAVDGGYPQRSGSVNITVSVEDVNDNAPAFSKNVFNITVNEDTSMNIPVLRLMAADADSAQNGALTYAFSSRTSKKVREQFAVDHATGDLFLIKPLDFEKDKRLQFVVIVKDNGVPRQQAQAAVIVNVADINDNAPKIAVSLPPGGTNLAESVEVGSFIAHVSVSDADEGKNGEIACSVTNKHFKLERFSDFSYIYKILLQKGLDFEKSRQEYVNVSCTDRGTPPRRNSSSFVIHVHDENDNAPIFGSPVYHISVKENLPPGRSIFQVLAMDPDMGKNGNISYSLVENPESAFTIDSVTGILRTMKKFDREGRSHYRLLVRAKDGGRPTMSSSATVHVNISDVNDSPTHFAQSHFEFYVEEEQPRGSVVDRLRVVDMDEQTSNQLQYSFLPEYAAPSEFTIDVSTGDIITTRPLDRENGISVFDFKVFVVDAENVLFNDSASVRVTVTDINDHAPNITFPSKVNHTVRIPYTVPAGTIVTRVQAHDQDKGENGSTGMTYNLDGGDTKDMFLMNGINGELILTRRLHPQDVNTYHLRVSVQDSGQVVQMTTIASLNIMVTRSNSSGLFSSGGEADHNIAIVITLVCVTVALALAVLATICIIRRIDRERKHHTHTKKEEQNIYKQETLPPAFVEEKTPAMENYENEIEKLKRKIKRELSFVSDDDMLESNESINNGGATSFSTFKKSSPLSTPQMFSTSQRSGSPDNGSGNTSVKRVHYVDRSRDMRPVSPAMSPTGPSWSQHPRPLTTGLTVRAEGEDAGSHTSGSTSDSGRGGSSEEDGASHAGVSLTATESGEDLRPLSSRSYLTTPGLSTFRSPHSARVLLSPLPGADSSSSSSNPISTSTSNIYTNLPSKSSAGQHNRSISFSDDVAVDAERGPHHRTSQFSSPQQEQQQQQQQQQRRLLEDVQPAPPRGILTNKDGHYRSSYRAAPFSHSQQPTNTHHTGPSHVSKSLPYRKQQPSSLHHSQRHSPPLLPSPDGSATEGGLGEEELYGTRTTKAVNFAVGNSFEMTPRRTGSAARLDEGASPVRRSSSGVEEGGRGGVGSSRSGRGGFSFSTTDSGNGRMGEEEEEELNTTTTSGSYTVGGEDDFRRDVDNLFLNDVVV